MALCPECIIAFGFEQLCLFVCFLNVFCTSGVYFTNANSLAYCGNLRLLETNFGPFCNGKKHTVSWDPLPGGTFCVFSKRCWAFPPPSEISGTQPARRKPTMPWAWHIREKSTILLLINHDCKNTQGPRVESKAQCSLHSPDTERREGEDDPRQGRWEDGGWFRTSWEDSGRVFKQGLAFVSHH